MRPASLIISSLNSHNQAHTRPGCISHPGRKDYIMDDYGLTTMDTAIVAASDHGYAIVPGPTGYLVCNADTGSQCYAADTADGIIDWLLLNEFDPVFDGMPSL